MYIKTNNFRYIIIMFFVVFLSMDSYAQTYADEHWDEYDEDYNDYREWEGDDGKTLGDCANFVCQVFMEDWGYYFPDIDGVTDEHGSIPNSNNLFGFFSDGGCTVNIYTYGQSIPSYLMPGDVVMLGSVQTDGSVFWYHSYICYKPGKLAAHTENRINFSPSQITIGPGKVACVIYATMYWEGGCDKHSIISNIPNNITLSAYPNPFNLSTLIEYNVIQPSAIRIKIYDSIGRLVRNLASERRDAGQYSVMWDGKNDYGQIVASGIYICRMQFNNQVYSRRLLLIK